MRPSLSPSLALGAALLLAGCAVGPNYRAPTDTAPPAFVGAAAVGARPANAGAPADLSRWWLALNDPLLTDFVDRALAQNLDLQQAVARVSQSRAALKGANAALLPTGQVSGQAGANRQSTEVPIGRLASSFPGYQRNTDIYELDLGASWEIDAFGGLSRSREAARAEWQASQAGAVAARLTVAAQTADTYVAIRGLQLRLAIAREQLETQRRLVALVGLQYSKGVAAELQLRQAEGALAQVEASVPELEAALDVAMNALDVLVGEQPGTARAALAAAAPIPGPPALDTAIGPAELLRRRPDIIAAERTLAASNARIGAAISEYYPKFTLSGLLGSASTAGSGLFGGGAIQASGVLGLRWRLFDFGRIDAQIQAARGRNVEALAAYRLTVLRASEDVENAFSALVKREEQGQLLQKGEASLQRARDTSLAAYKGGAVSLVEVLDADQRLLATRDARAQAQTAATRAAIASFRALGGGWTPPETRVAATTESGPATR